MINNKRVISVIVGLLFLTIALAACQGVAQPPDQSIVETIAAQTLAVDQSQATVRALEEEIAKIGQTQTALAMPTSTPLPTQTPIPTQPETTSTCNQAAFVADLTIEDRTVLDPGKAFTKVWRIKNTGECTWNTDYRLIHSSGYTMQAPTAIYLPEIVYPNQTVDIALNMVAPDSAGTYAGYWMLIDDNGNLFGVGADDNAPIWVRIRVTNEDEIIVYNLAENYCDAGWESNTQKRMPCPSEKDLENGFVQGVDLPRLEDDKIYPQPAILTYPAAGRSGYLVGRYPSLRIREGDHFRALIGCRSGAYACNVNFTVRVAIAGKGFETLGHFREVYEGLLTPIDIDLSEYAGEDVQLTLSAIAFDDTNENFALWIDPRVVRPAD